MLLTSVIIVLREVLEAALLLSMLSAVSKTLALSRRWTFSGIGFGLVGAILYSFCLATVSEWFDGVGQELLGAILQIMIYLLLATMMLMILRRLRHPDAKPNRILFLMAFIVALSVTREGFEILVYLYGFSSALDQFITVSMGATIGAGIGISTGVLVYYVLCHPALQRSPLIGFGLVALFGAGLLSQAIILLIQADWLPSQLPLWNTNTWIPESSVTGQFLYVLIGYESTPTAIQACFHFVGISVLFSIALNISSYSHLLPHALQKSIQQVNNRGSTN